MYLEKKKFWSFLTIEYVLNDLNDNRTKMGGVVEITVNLVLVDTHGAKSLDTNTTLHMYLPIHVSTI